ncbi:Uncharacterized protein SCF082_LOCUS16391 [Durusdinium trenchii]|uniref:Uncharacterized protein n=1 Tax=Durusdinium trenchii TaxID=1381693 RepID=A0ABP0KAR6_9DINO
MAAVMLGFLVPSHPVGEVAEQDIEMLQERLQRAVEAKELLEALGAKGEGLTSRASKGETEGDEDIEDAQLTEPPASHHSTMLSDAEILAPITALQQATRDLARSAALADDASQDYWRRAAAWLGVQRHRGWAALYGSYMRDPVNGAGAAGACMEPANAPPLPVFDPEDPELPASYARLALVAEEKQKRRQAQEASRATEADAALEEEILGMVLEQAIDENTGRSPSEWEDIVTQLSQADASWDWSKLEVRQVEPRKKNSLCVSLGVFAVAPAPDEPEDDATVGPSESKEVPEGEAPPAPPPLVFEAGDLVGPIGGLLRRKKAYMAEHYGSSVWFFHDPNAHELPLRIQSTELRTEPLVVDLSLGSSNRLRFLRDRREDPLELSELLPPPSDASLAEQSLISEPLWPARSAMARINSRSLPPSLAPPMSAPMSRGPDSPIAASLAASSICASSYEQMVLAPAEANVQIVDVHVHGWPYSFVVATNPIYAEEELVLDRGEEFWARQRKVLERLQLVGPTMEEILTGVACPAMEETGKTGWVFVKNEAGVVSLAEGYEVQKSGRAKLMGGLQQDCGRSDHLVAEGRGETSELSQRLSFPTLQLQAGTLVICYCAQLTDDACTGTWFYLGLLQVSGPQPGHRWVLPTRQKVGLQDLQGWGFRVDDRLRLLDKGSSCSSAPSSSAYKVGCSSNSSCRVALEDETIEVRVANNLLSGAELLEVHVESDSSSILTFSAPIGHLLQDGDAIYLEPESILIDGRGLNSMSEDEQFDAMLLAGMASDARRAFSFVPGQLQWFRANRLDSEETGESYGVLTSSVGASVCFEVCWAPNEGGAVQFYSEAGTVSFTDPPELLGRSVLAGESAGKGLGARLGLTSRRSGSTSAVLISFSPSRAVVEYRRSGRTGRTGWEQSTGHMLLGLRFLNSSQGHSLGRGLGLLPAGPSVGATQGACGALFTELWSDAASGFPVPVSCWMSDLGANGEPHQRELFILFERMSDLGGIESCGLRNQCPGSSCTYQLVLDAVATDLTIGQEVLDIDVACSFAHGGCDRRYQIYERASVVSEQRTEPGSGGGFSVALREAGSDGVLLWTQVLGLRLTTTSPIQAGQTLRLFMAPFTQWSVRGESFGVLFARLDVGVDVERYAILKLQLPTVDLAAAAHLLTVPTVTGLPMPVGVLFPALLHAEVTTVFDTEPEYLAAGYFASGVATTPGSAAAVAGGVARMVRSGRQGFGPMPFVGKRNWLQHRYAQIQPPATTGATSTLEIFPPQGLACDLLGPLPASVVPSSGAALLRGEGAAVFDGQLETLLRLERTTGGDRDLDGFPDVLRGALQGEGLGALGTSSCFYSLGEIRLHLFQPIFLALELLNPSQPLALAAWTVRLSSRGERDNGELYSVDWTFSASDEDLWTGGVAVLGLLEATLQPSAFGRGSPNNLSILFKPLQEVPPNGSLVLDGPLHFDLTGCRHGVLPGARPLPDPGPCSTSQTPRQRTAGTALNRAELKLGGWLRGKWRYGFQLLITNPTGEVGDESGDDGYGFYLWTTHPSKGPLDGSAAPVGMVEGEVRSWQLSSELWETTGVSLQVASGFLKPFSTFGLVDTLKISDLRLPGSGTLRPAAVLRLLAPPQVRFRAEATEITAAAVARRLTQLRVNPKVDLSGLEVAPVTYTFKVPFEVEVQQVPFEAAADFVLEMSGGGGLAGAKRFAAPILRSLVGASMRCNSQHVGAFTELRFHIPLGAPLPKESMLLLQADVSTPGLTLHCPMQAEEAPGWVPDSVACAIVSVSASFAWQLTSSVGWAAGSYVLRGQASHVAGISWTISSYSPEGDPLDAPGTAGCPQSELLPSSLDFSTASHKPRQPTEVFFTLELPEAIAAGSSLTVRAPSGYVLRAEAQPNCAQRLRRSC